jgi:hypothetical protein
MNAKAKKILKEIKAEDFTKWSASFWLVKKKGTSKDVTYNVLRVEMDEKLQTRFRRYLRQQLQGKEFHVAEYDYNNADGDDSIFTLAADTTDFVKVEVAINAGFDNPLAANYEDLLKSWAYIILFEKDNKRLYAWRKISADTQPKKVYSKNTVFFQNHKLIDLDDKEVFMIYPRYDFFVYDGMTLIADKRQFESSMNFREGMKENGKEVLSAFEELAIFDDIKIIRDFVGTNLHHLRKLSSIRKAGYYKQPDYMKNLIKVSKTEKWKLKIANGKIIVEKETVELLLKLLNNDRLRSPINNEVFDAAAKARVSDSKVSAT